MIDRGLLPYSSAAVLAETSAITGAPVYGCRDLSDASREVLDRLDIAR